MGYVHFKTFLFSYTVYIPFHNVHYHIPFKLYTKWNNWYYFMKINRDFDNNRVVIDPERLRRSGVLRAGNHKW